MAIEYVMLEKGNPTNPQAPKKWYANAKNNGSVSLKELNKQITKYCRVSSETTFFVLNALTKVLCDNLANGKIVRLGDFGSFQITLSSEGAESAEKFNSSQIKKPKVVFRPSADIKEMLNALEFKKL